MGWFGSDNLTLVEMVSLQVLNQKIAVIGCATTVLCSEVLKRRTWLASIPCYALAAVKIDIGMHYDAIMARVQGRGSLPVKFTI